MSLRIVIDVRHIKDFGIGTYIRNLVQALSTIDSENQYILTSNSPEVPEIGSLAPNFEIAVYHAPKHAHWSNLTYPWFLHGLAPNVVHMPLNEVPVFMPKPYVVTIHDLSSFLFSGKGGAIDDARLYGFRRGLARADRVIAVSDATRRDVENLLGIPASRIRQVYSAPDPKFFLRPSTVGEQSWNRERLRLLERYQIQYPFVLYAGRIRPHKNIPRLIEAFAVARSGLQHDPKYRDIRLVIIGDEITKHPEVRRAVVQTRTEQFVRFLGFVPFDALKVFYSSARAFLFPSLYEGFGLPPLEAMATGTPVVTSSVSSLPEVVGDAAMIVNPENVFDMARGIREVILDDELRLRLIAAGYRQVHHFNWRATAEQVLEVYGEVARKR